MASRKPTNVNGTVYRYDISSTSSIFSSNFAYRKGAWVLHQLRRVVGDPTFFAILAHWRQTRLFGSGDSEDFIQAAEDVYGQDLHWYFDPWLYDPGALSYQYGTTSVVVNGFRYLLVHLRQNQSSSCPTYTMPVDLRFTDGAQTRNFVLKDSARLQHYVIPVQNVPSGISIDPDGWLLTTSVSTQTYSPGPPKVVRTYPPPGAGGDYDLTRVDVTFHTPVVATASDFEVRTQSGVAIGFNYVYNSATNTASLYLVADIDIAGLTVTVKDSIRAANSNMQLDGETSNGTVLPTGDGLPGGNAVIRIGWQ
jgi:hypothetical protein